MTGRAQFMPLRQARPAPPIGDYPTFRIPVQARADSPCRPLFLQAPATCPAVSEPTPIIPTTLAVTRPLHVSRHTPTTHCRARADHPVATAVADAHQPHSTYRSQPGRDRTRRRLVFTSSLSDRLSTTQRSGPSPLTPTTQSTSAPEPTSTARLAHSGQALLGPAHAD